MRLPTDSQFDKRWFVVSLLAILYMFVLSTRASAQIASSNPLEYAALAEGNELINAQIKSEIDNQQKTALFQNTIAAEFTQIRKWEKKYNSYLKTVDGYASTLKACTTLTATELISVYTALREAVAKGGTENMLTGAERSKTLWALNDRLASFNKKLNKLCLSIKFYTMTDVWNSVTAGMIERTNGEIANQAHSRWVRAAKTVGY